MDTRRESRAALVEESGARIALEASTHLAEMHVGTVVDRQWTLEALLGVGGSGFVYRARHRSGARMALKVLRGEEASRPHAREQLEREAALTRRVGHPAVAVAHHVGEDPTLGLYMALDCVDGASLAVLKRARGGVLLPREALEIAIRLTEVVGAVHDAGVVHCDVKPANVLCARGGEVVLCDFGIAVAPREPLPEHLELSLRSGTPGYMAPEQWRLESSDLDERADVWSLASTAYSLLAGRPPVGDGAAGVLPASWRPPLPNTFVPPEYLGFGEALAGALVSDRTRRTPNARVLGAQLRAHARRRAG